MITFRSSRLEGDGKAGHGVKTPKAPLIRGFRAASALQQDAMKHGSGGEGGIRTRGAFDSTLLFESSTLNHSDTSPREIIPALVLDVMAALVGANGWLHDLDKPPPAIDPCRYADR